MTAPTFDLTADGIETLALPVDLDTRLLDALNDGDHHVEITTAINAAVNRQLAESGWDGDWSAEHLVRAILDTAEVADGFTAHITGIAGMVGTHTEMEIRHGLVEGAENDHGDSQATAVTFIVGGDYTNSTETRYSLPADRDNEQVYWRAFEAAGDYLAEWLGVHGVDPTAETTFGTGWSLTFTRSQWQA